MPVTIHAVSKGDTQEVARLLANEILKTAPPLRGALVVALFGELGAGKTTFIKSFAKALGVKGRVLSPTFVFVKRHRLSKKRYKALFHYDCYRIKEKRELFPLGWKEAIKNKTNIIVIEWASRIRSSLPMRRVDVRLKHHTPKERRITVSFHGI